MIKVLAGLNGGIKFGRFQWPEGFISDVSVSMGSMQRVPWAYTFLVLSQLSTVRSPPKT